MTTSFFDGVEFVRNRYQPQWVGWSNQTYTYYVLHYLHRGRIDVSWNGEPIEHLHGPAVWLAYPKARLYCTTVDLVGIDFAYFAFQGPRVKRYLETGLLRVDPEHRYLSVGDPARYYQQATQLERMLTLNQLPPAHATQLFESMLLQLHEPSPRHDATRLQTLRQLAHTIREHPRHGWDFNAEARQVHLSLPHFRRLFRTATGKPPQQFLFDACMSQASALLHDSSLDIAQVAQRLGFDDPAYFSRCFRQWAGMPPRAFRRSIGHRPHGDKPTDEKPLP